MAKQFKSVEERVEMFRSFYRRENPRPLLGFFLGSEYPVPRYPSMASLPEGRALTPEDFPMDGFLDDSERLHVGHEECGGDFIWSASAYWGIPWLEAALGCPLYVSHATGSIYSEPPAGFAGPADIPQFDPDNTWMRLMDRYLTGLNKRSAGRWPVATTRMRGISDLLSALYGGSEFVMAMLETPGEVHAACKSLVDFWLGVAEFQLSRIPAFHGGVGSFYYNCWAPAGTVWCQEDATALLSPDLYGAFVEPALRAVVAAVDGAIMHQHSTGYVPTESYLTMDFHALELHIDEGGPSAEELYSRHQTILDKKPLIIWGKMTEEDLHWIFSRLPTKGLAVIHVVESAQEAAAVWERYGAPLDG